jgi:hypothetical protein
MMAPGPAGVTRTGLGLGDRGPLTLQLPQAATLELTND